MYRKRGPVHGYALIFESASANPREDMAHLDVVNVILGPTALSIGGKRGPSFFIRAMVTSAPCILRARDEIIARIPAVGEDLPSCVLSERWRLLGMLLTWSAL